MVSEDFLREAFAYRRRQAIINANKLLQPNQQELSHYDEEVDQKQHQGQYQIFSMNQTTATTTSTPLLITKRNRLELMDPDSYKEMGFNDVLTESQEHKNDSNKKPCT